MNEYVDSNPWAGLSSYEDPDKAEREGRKPKLFCGRDDESHNVTQLINGNIFVTLYGKSGTGKTSLLNAGVFPRLRQKRYLPVCIRLSMDALDTTFQQSIVHLLSQAIQFAGGKQQTVDVVPLPNNEQQPDYLWAFFARTRFLNTNGQTLFPVIVLDQFEEIFRDRRNEAEALLRQIAYLMDESHALSSRIVDGQPYKYDFNFRFVASIREDDLYRLEDSIDNNYLPELKRCRYRLRSLTDQGARDAILIPGEHLFLPEEQNGIVSSIIDKSRNEDGSISTNIVSLLCNRIYVDYKRSGADYITPTLVDSFLKGNPFERFYNEATRGFSNREKSYIEDYLVDSTGRRNSIPESDFQKHVKNGATLLEGERKILQRTSTSSDGGNYRIELIHDSFCEPLAALKEKRERHRRYRWLAGTAAIALLCLGITGYILYQMNKIRNQEGTIAQQDANLLVTNRQLQKEKDSLRLANEKRMQLFKDLQFQKGISDSTNQQLKLSFHQLTKKEQELSHTNQGMLINQSRVLAEKAITLVDEGDSYLARLIALQALPPHRPYTIEAEGALRTAIQHNDAILRGHTSSVESASFSPDGKRIVSISDDNTIRIWDSQTGKQIGQLPEGHTKKVSSASFSPDGKHIVSASYDKTIRIWDTQTSKQIGQPFEGHTRPVNSVSFSPDGKRIVSASSDNTIRIWDTQTGKQIGKPLEGHTDHVLSASFSPDGKRIVSASSDNTIRIWDAQTGKQVGRPLTGHTYLIYSVSFSPDGKLIVSASRDETVRIWDAKTGWQIGQPLKGHTNSVSTASFSPDGKLIVSASYDNTIRIWDALTGKQVGQPLKGHIHPVKSASFSSDGKRIVSASSDETIRIWDVQPGMQMGKQLKVHTNSTRIATFSPDGKCIISSAELDKTVRIWDAQTGKQIGKPLEGHTESVTSASFSPDGKLIVSTSWDKTIRIWDVQTGRQIGQPLEGHTDPVYSASFSPDGKRIVSASWDKTIRIWDAQTGKQIGKPLKGHTNLVSTASFSPDGKRIVSASYDKTVRIWDAHTGKQIGKPLKGHTGDVMFATFSPDGKRIVSASHDKTVRIWDAHTGKQIGKPLEGDTSQVDNASFSPDGKYIVSASYDHTVRIRDAHTGKQIGKPLNGHTGAVFSASFSPDGKRIVSASHDKTVRIWDFHPLQQLIDETRDRFKNRQLTPEERRKYYLE